MLAGDNADHEKASAPSRTIVHVNAFIGTEALASGTLTRGQLRWNYRAIHPNVYIPKELKRTLAVNTEAAWLWTKRTGIVAGRAAAALHGVHGFDEWTPIELIAKHTRRERGVVIREERIDDDEVYSLGETRCTSAARTALDLGRHLPRNDAVQYLDELARIARLTDADVDPLLERYRGARGIPQARVALGLMDAGAQCREETRMRLLLNDAGMHPRTDITITDGHRSGRIGMGWEEVKLGVSYFPPSRDGGSALAQDLRHHELVQLTGWTEIGFVGITRNWRSVVYRVRNELIRRRRRWG